METIRCVEKSSTLNQRRKKFCVHAMISELLWRQIIAQIFRVIRDVHAGLPIARGCSEDLHYDRPRNLPSNPLELLCICIVRVYTDSYVVSQNSLFCLLTCNNDHKSLYMPILWYVIISRNSMLKSLEVHNSCLKPRNPGTKIPKNCC